ncbi:O-antigen ligase family protein, partial [Granulosicoccus sp.]
LLYLPFAKSYVIPVLPGLNGTNMLIMLGLGTAFMYASREKVKIVVWPPGSSLVIAFGIYTALSAFTILQHPGGGSLLSSEILSFKSWLDQFIIYLILVCLIRDKEGAKRAVVYLMIGTMAVVIHTIPEMLEKMGRSSIEKSRIIGPQLQSNNFGGFVAYTLLPMLAFFMVFIKDIRAWMLTPYFLLAIKVLITTFSRGAYVAVALGGLLVGYYRGKAFLMGVAVFAICVVAAFPAVIPESISARMGGLIGSEEAATSAPEEEKLDKSSSTRFVMWEAAGQMMIESPVLGKGFKGFQFLKDQYVEGDHPEDDPHSMYFYLGSQMGIPALVLFFCIMGYMFKLGRFHSKNKHDRFIRAVGIGGTAIPVCYAVICIFGSRATALNFTIYFWAYLVVLQVLKKASDEGLLEQVSGITGKSSSRSKRSRRNTAGSQSDSVLAMESANDPQLELKPRSKRRVAERAPKRGAAAFMEKEAERKALEALAQIQIEALRANRQGKGTSLAAQSTDIQQQPYETRAARRAREAAEQAASAGRQKRQRGG